MSGIRGIAGAGEFEWLLPSGGGTKHRTKHRARTYIGGEEGEVEAGGEAARRGSVFSHAPSASHC